MIGGCDYGKEQFVAVARDVDEKGRLVVELTDGSVKILNNEEVSAKLNEHA
jgi:biotin-(acetyl-CoA carboxylase) ligase